VSHLFYSLAILACPLGMGAMMWMMMRGGKQTGPVGDDPAKAAELARLQTQIDTLRAQQNRQAQPEPEQPISY